MEQVFFGMLKTWLHIFLGISIVTIGYLWIYALLKWISTLKERFEK